MPSNVFNVYCVLIPYRPVTDMATRVEHVFSIRTAPTPYLPVYVIPSFPSPLTGNFVENCTQTLMEKKASKKAGGI